MINSAETLANEIVPTPSRAASSVTGLLELLDTRPTINVEPAEFRRLLGYPRDYTPTDRAEELATWARQWYAEHGRPWIYAREARVDLTADGLEIEGTIFESAKLRQHLRDANAQRAVLVAVSAGAACEEHARQLWLESKPDEYFFLEVYGSAVVEHLVASLNGRICEIAEGDGRMAIPHYSPGYTGWDVTDQNKLFELIGRGATKTFPEAIGVLASGMLKPKKSLLALVGLAPKTERSAEARHGVPCTQCAFAPCTYRRAPYRAIAATINERPFAHTPGPTRPKSAFPLSRDANYTVSRRALEKWSRERVDIERLEDGGVRASFRFEGTTCSNLGRPLAFDYVVRLTAPSDAFKIVQADCRPAADDDGYKSMCAYSTEAESFMAAIAREHPLLGRPLNDVLEWTRASVPSGCLCDQSGRLHKWGLALETIHFALARLEADENRAAATDSVRSFSL